ncbi:MAG TPA: 23S rRNA (pseudouridine(1915)-N(3))-methyltransferase RlmH [Candidatus Absconditabacterales bacterium]|nr:23S rRNA (pseudouridine(1915)-N(3))-methyltransferase RlmH [Candidatus Absconditabacterales bacterium]
MKYCILNISDSDKHWSEGISEYIKRLGKEVFVENIKPIKNGSQDQIIQKETELILDKLENKYKDWNKILLSKSGKQYSTEELKKFLGYEKTVFVIGGPYGLDENILKQKGIKSISFGKITLPHGLAKLTLLEQIYRIGTIESGKKYHY